jgi:hypothetical protein
MCSSLRGRFIPSTKTSIHHDGLHSTTQTLILSSHYRHRNTTQTLQPYHRHRTSNADLVLAMIGGQVGLFPEDRKQACRFKDVMKQPDATQAVFVSIPASPRELYFKDSRLKT